MRALALVAAAFATPLLLLACAAKPHTPTVGPWGYAFTLGEFSDQRPRNDAMLMAKVPFRIDQFMTQWNQIVAQDVFYRNDARLDVILKDYNATQARINYALSMDVTLRARDEKGRVIATLDTKCSSVQNPGFTQVGDFTQQVVTKGDFAALTYERRAATMWQRVLHACVEDLAIEFGQALAQRH